MRTRARILLIDDAAVCAFLQTVLSQAGYEVMVALNSQEGLACYAAASIDLVITDLLMPEQEGIETILALRQLNPQVPIIAISGGGQTGRMNVLHIAAVLGAHRILRKPFSPQALLEAVRALTHREDAGGK